MEQLRAVVSGKVQMVMYRDFTMQQARALGVCGFVRNLPDGTVEVLAEGKREDLDALVTKLWEGPFHAEVTDVVVTWSAPTDSFKDFCITGA